MSATLDISRLHPLGTKVLVKRKPADERVKSILLPQDVQERNNIKGDLFCGIAIAAGPRSKSAQYGHDRAWFEPGDTVWFWHLYDFADKEMIIKDDSSGDKYLMIDESDIKAYERGNEHE